MSKAVLQTVKKEMDALGINYRFKRRERNPVYPYFTGEYQEVESINEDGMQETQFILTGFARGDSAIDDLEEIKEKIQKHFPQVGGKVAITDSGSAVAIFYASAFENLPTGDAELEKIQINLSIKEWSV